MTKIQESGENYLETILILQTRNGYVRSIDIVNELGFTKPSISRAMKVLRDNGYIQMEKGGRIRLTERGKTTAEQVYERHCLLKQYLIALGVSEATATQDACRIEHIISQESFDAIKAYAEKRENL